MGPRLSAGNSREQAKSLAHQHREGQGAAGARAAERAGTGATSLFVTAACAVPARKVSPAAAGLTGAPACADHGAGQ